MTMAVLGRGGDQNAMVTVAAVVVMVEVAA